MKYFYDKGSDSLYLTLAERKYADSIEAAQGVVLDFDSAGRLIGIDLEHASRMLDIAHLSLYGEPAEAELPKAKLDGAEIKRQRGALGLSQVQLARQLGVAANTVARWERGELKIEHPGMLLLALSALKHQSGGSLRQAPRRPAVKNRRASAFRKSAAHAKQKKPKAV